MINIFLLVGGLIVTVIAGFISFIENKKENRRDKKSIRNNSILFISIIVGALLSTSSGYISLCEKEDSDRQKYKSDSLFHDSQQRILELQISTKDTIVDAVKNTFINSIKASNEALAKYNLKITDSMRSVVRKLKIDALNPQLRIRPLEKDKQPAFLSKSKDKLQIQFISVGGTSYRIHLTCYFLQRVIGDHYTCINIHKFAHGDTFITENVSSTRDVPITPDILLKSEIIVYIHGSFTKDSEGNYIVPFDDVFEFNMKENKYIGGLDLNFAKLKEYLKIK